MKKALFSRGIYAEGLRRLRVFGFIALAALLTLELAPIIISLFDYVLYYRNDPISTYSVSDITFDIVLLAVPFAVIVASPIMTIIAFSVFNKRSSSDFYHSLPYSRQCIFLSTISAVYTWIIGICLICSLSGLILYSAFDNLFVVIFDLAGEIILTYIAILILTTATTALAMSATGTVFSNICVTLLLMFLPRFIITVISSWISDTTGFLPINEIGHSFLSFDINGLFALVGGLFTGNIAYYHPNLTTAIYTLLLGIAYLFAALFVFIKRKSETATRSAPTTAIQHIVRILISVAVGILSVILFLEGLWAAFVIVSIIGVIVYFAYELLTTHKWKNCLKALPFLPVSAGICILCGAVMVAVPSLACTYMPSPEDIQHVRFINDYDRYYGHYGWYGAGMEELEITDPSVLETVSATLDSNMKEYKAHGYLGASTSYKSITSSYIGDDRIEQTVAIKSGPFTKYRTLYFEKGDYDNILRSLENIKEYVTICKTLPKPAPNSISFELTNNTASSDEKKDIFNTLQAEIYELPIEKWYHIANYSYYPANAIDIYYYSDSYKTMDVSFPITPESFPETYKMLMDVENTDYDKKLSTLTNMLENFDDPESEAWYKHVYAGVYNADSENRPAYYAENENAPSYYYAEIMYDSPRYDRGMKAEYEYIEIEYLEALMDMMEKVKNCDEEATPQRYIYVTFASDSKDEYSNGALYLPLPDDFDPVEWNFNVESLEDPMLYD